jgi:hypothetical protein
MDPILLLLIMLVVMIIAWALLWGRWRSNTILRNWANQNGYRIAHTRRRYISQGPFKYNTGVAPVFRVEVEDHQGHRRTGWVRCGSIMWGIFNDQAMALWDV